MEQLFGVNIIDKMKNDHKKYLANLSDDPPVLPRLTLRRFLYKFTKADLFIEELRICKK